MPFNAKRLHLKVAMVFLAVFSVGAVFVQLYENNEVNKRQQIAMEVASIHGHLLQEQTARSLSATFALAAVLKQGGGRIDNFEQMAAQMLPLYGGISSLQLAPGGVIRQIVPLAGNEVAIGHDLLADPERNKEAVAAVDKRALTLAGPFVLRQGGVAVVGRLPVFLQGKDGNEHFWGFTTALVKISDLLQASQLTADSASEYGYELSRVHPDSQQREVFWASSGLALVAPLSYAISVPNGVWTLSVAPLSGWSSPLPILALAWLGILVISAMASFLAFRIFREPEILARQVVLRTSELSLANESLKTEIVEHWRAEIALRESETLLEARVEERTAQLAAANGALQVETTHQKALVAKLAETQNQLLQAEMMASIGQLAAGVAHEINNPLGFIASNLGCLQSYSLGLLDLVAAYEMATTGLESGTLNTSVTALRDKLDLSYLRHDLPQLLADSQEGIARIKRIVTELQDFSRVDDSNWEMQDINHLLDSTLNLLQSDISPKADVVRCFGVIPEIECLPFQISQLFLHLLRNAAQAIAERGEIAVATRLDAAWVVVTISDTGQGIAPENLKRIFDPFFTTKPVGQGTGLGLSLAYSIVKTHGGQILVESQAGSGTQFEIRLPARNA